MYTGPILDTDVHNQPANPAELIPYVPERSRDMVARMVATGVMLDPKRAIALVPGGGYRLDGAGPNGEIAGSSLPILQEQLLDHHNISRALLTHNTGEYGAHFNPYLSTDLCIAANDWMVDRWLGVDERLYAGICVPVGDPDAARAEIRRLAGHPHLSCVLLSVSVAGARPVGDPQFHPIYEAAHEAGLPLFLHISTALPSTAQFGGPSATATQVTPNAMLAASHHISSLIVHGVFERFPNLKFLFAEYGLSWLPATLWNLDAQYARLREESPWVKRAPSEYVHDFIRLTTQPLETTSDGRDLAKVLQAVDGIEDFICFSTDYPHFTMDDVRFAARILPDAWHRKVFYENAADLLDWHLPEARPVVAGAAEGR